MTDGFNHFYWKEIVGTILWISLIYFLVGADGWNHCKGWLEQFLY